MITSKIKFLKKINSIVFLNFFMKNHMFAYIWFDCILYMYNMCIYAHIYNIYIKYSYIYKIYICLEDKKNKNYTKILIETYLLIYE